MNIKNPFIEFAFVILCAVISSAAQAQANSLKETRMTATGSFDVQLAPQKDDTDSGRLVIDKEYHGDMQGEGKGQMLSKRTTTDGSAGYVAIEQFDGKIGNLEGAFTLIHKGIMDRGEDSLDISVIPDSGTEDFVGITGAMQITIVDGKHSYQFDYNIATN